MRRPHDEDPSPRRTSRRGPCRPPTGACRPPGIPSTSRNTSRRQCLRGGTVRRCSPRRVVLPARCGFSPPPSTADESGAECPSALVLPALCPVRISVSSSLLTATMNQKSSLREVPQFVSWVLTGNRKLFNSSWNLSREPSRRPRILFLADRNILADQAYNAFSAFDISTPGSLVRIDPA